MALKHHTIIMKKLLAPALLLSILFLLGGGRSVAHAQAASQGEQIGISPASQSFQIDAGSSMQGSMKVINEGQIGYDFIVYARPYSVNDEQYDPNFTIPKPNADAYKWIQFEKTSFHINPGQIIQVNYTINVPAGATPGGHYGVLFAETKEKPLGTTGVTRTKRVGDLMYVTVNGKYTTSGYFKDFVLPFWQHSGPFISDARVVNTGNVELTAKASTVVQDVFGRTKFTNTGNATVLPGTTRLIEMKWDKAPKFGFFKVYQSVTLLGHRYAHSGYVLIAPVWFPVLLVIILVGGAGYAIVKKYIRHR